MKLMDPGILSVINSMIESGLITETGLLLIIICLILLCYRYILKPIYDKIFKIPSFEEVKVLIDASNELKKIDFADLSEKIEKLETLLDSINDFDKDSCRQLTDLKRDIEEIKRILNQFQGHLMYSGGRRSADFGNRELS